MCHFFFPRFFYIFPPAVCKCSMFKVNPLSILPLFPLSLLLYLHLSHLDFCFSIEIDASEICLFGTIPQKKSFKISMKLCVYCYDPFFYIYYLKYYNTILCPKAYSSLSKQINQIELLYV